MPCSQKSSAGPRFMNFYFCFCLQTLKLSFSGSFWPSASVPACGLPPPKTSNTGAALIPPPAAGLFINGGLCSREICLTTDRQCWGGGVGRFPKKAQRNTPSRLGPSCSPHPTCSENRLGDQQQGLWSWCSFAAAFSFRKFPSPGDFLQQKLL